MPLLLLLLLLLVAALAAAVACCCSCSDANPCMPLDSVLTCQCLTRRLASSSSSCMSHHVTF
jgi:hypothetical protein